MKITLTYITYCTYFQRICQNDLSSEACLVNNRSARTDPKMCASVHAYTSACALHGVIVHEPRCLQCDDGHQLLDSWRESPGSGLDVLVVNTVHSKEQTHSLKRVLLAIDRKYSISITG